MIFVELDSFPGIFLNEDLIHLIVLYARHNNILTEDSFGS